MAFRLFSKPAHKAIADKTVPGDLTIDGDITVNGSGGYADSEVLYW